VIQEQQLSLELRLPWSACRSPGRGENRRLAAGPPAMSVLDQPAPDLSALQLWTVAPRRPREPHPETRSAVRQVERYGWPRSPKPAILFIGVDRQAVTSSGW